MRVPRETIYLALYNLLLGITDWNFIDRRFHVISELNQGQFPAIMMVQKPELSEVAGRGIPIKWTLKVDVVVYVDTTNNPDRVPAELLNPILDDIEAAVQPNVNNPGLSPQTLGGLVCECRIRGEVMTDEGTLGTHGFIAVPVEIIVQA